MTKKMKAKTKAPRGIWDSPGHSPVDATEREARARARFGARYCNQMAPRPSPEFDDVWICTRAPGHRGDHVAANTATIVGRWGQS